jgi:hypothetical protein
MRLIYHHAAEAELISAARFYETRVSGLGREFLAEFEHCIAAVLAALIAGGSSKTTCAAA